MDFAIAAQKLSANLAGKLKCGTDLNVGLYGHLGGITGVIFMFWGFFLDGRTSHQFLQKSLIIKVKKHVWMNG